MFIVPTRRANVATYLAKRDPWYRRQVHSAFSAHNIAPRVEFGADSDTDKARTMSPMCVSSVSPANHIIAVVTLV